MAAESDNTPNTQDRNHKLSFEAEDIILENLERHIPHDVCVLSCDERGYHM
jgi:hypothetical protein